MPILTANNYCGGIMLKGVNKRIVEINDPDSLYFERAVFYLRPNVSIIPDMIPHDEAERLYSRIAPYNKKRSRKLGTGKILIISASAASLILLFMKII